MGWHKLAALMGAVVLSASCAAVSGMRDDVVAGFCSYGASDRRGLLRTEAPANADLYRRFAAAQPAFPDRRPRGDEYWFVRADGGVRYCVSPLERSSTVPVRNGSGCDDRIGVWWDFSDTDAGPATRGAEERICVN